MHISFTQRKMARMEVLLRMVLMLGSAGGVAAFELPPFSWDVTPRFVHCGPNEKGALQWSVFDVGSRCMIVQALPACCRK